MIDYVDLMCERWGESKRHIGAYRPPSSILGRIKDGWSIEAAGGTNRPCPPEVHVGDALTVNNAIQYAIEDRILTERLHAMLWVHYVWWTPRVKQKWALLELPPRRYYKRLHRSHLAIKPYLDSDEGHKKLAIGSF